MSAQLPLQIRFRDGRVVALPSVYSTTEGQGFDCSPYLTAFRLEAGLPVWEYDVEGVRFEKRVLMPHLQNTTHISYSLLSSEPVRLELRPLIAFRLHEAPVNQPLAVPYGVKALGDHFEVLPGGEGGTQVELKDYLAKQKAKPAAAQVPGAAQDTKDLLH